MTGKGTTRPGSGAAACSPCTPPRRGSATGRSEGSSGRTWPTFSAKPTSGIRCRRRGGRRWTCRVWARPCGPCTCRGRCARWSPPGGGWRSTSSCSSSSCTPGPGTGSSARAAGSPTTPRPTSPDPSSRDSPSASRGLRSGPGPRSGPTWSGPSACTGCYRGTWDAARPWWRPRRCCAPWSRATRPRSWPRPSCWPSSTSAPCWSSPLAWASSPCWSRAGSPRGSAGTGSRAWRRGRLASWSGRTRSSRRTWPGTTSASPSWTSSTASGSSSAACCATPRVPRTCW